MPERFRQIFDLDFLKVTGAGFTGFGTITFTDIDHAMKVIVFLITVSYMIWKWRKEAKEKSK